MDAPPVPSTMAPHRYTLAECIERAEANHPNIAAAKARLAFARAQQDEAKYAPYFNIRMGAGGGVIPSFIENGAVSYTTDLSKISLTSLSDLAPVVRFNLDAALPLYTFGKIDGMRDAAEANVRLNEWEREKARLQVRADVRRAYFGLQSTRDGLYVIDQALEGLDKGIRGLSEKLAKHEGGVEEVELTRLEFTRDDLKNRRGDIEKREREALVGLRFLTGIQSGFDVPDAPLKRPEGQLGPVLQYLTAARLYRPDVNISRAGTLARAAQLKVAKARLLPDFALTGGGVFWFAPAEAKRKNVTPDSGYVGLGFQWSLDFLPALARVDQAAAQLKEVQEMSRLALGGIAVEVETQYAAVIEAMKREETWAKAEKRAKGWLVTTQDAVELGTKDERAPLEPLRYHLNARAEHIRALFDLNVALAELARVTGWDAVAPK